MDKFSDSEEVEELAAFQPQASPAPTSAQDEQDKLNFLADLYVSSRDRDEVDLESGEIEGRYNSIRAIALFAESMATKADFEDRLIAGEKLLPPTKKKSPIQKNKLPNWETEQNTGP